MIRNVLFVCVGNICRSPMAEALFAQAMPRRMVCSAGLSAVVGGGADPLAVALMRERGLDISGHRAQQLASWMLHEADLILTMDGEQKRYIEQAWPGARGKVRRLLEAGGGDIPDPYRRGQRAFGHALSLIEEGVQEVLEHLQARRSEDETVQDQILIPPPTALQRSLPLSS